LRERLSLDEKGIGDLGGDRLGSFPLLREASGDDGFGRNTN
jgi:hypothetical protein